MKTKRGLPDMTWIPDKQLWRKRGTYKGHRFNITGKEPETVMEKIEAFKSSVDAGILTGGDTSVWQYSQRWYPSKVAGLKPKSREVYANALNNHILPRLGNLFLQDVKPLHIDDLLASMAGVSSSLQTKVLFTLNQLFRSAEENGLIPRNPCTGRKVGGERTKKKVPLTHSEQDTLTVAVSGTRAELLVLLCLYAGLRREEALGLLWSNVHLDADSPYLDVRHTTTFASSGKAIHSEALKTAAAYRSIPLPLQLSEELLRHRGKGKSAFVVYSETTGREVSPSAFRCLWELVAKAVDFHVTPHLLRHTYITELCASGMDIKKIQYLAGHATVQMTLNVYSHVTQNKPEQMAPDIISAFSRIPEGIPASEKEAP